MVNMWLWLGIKNNMLEEAKNYIDKLVKVVGDQPHAPIGIISYRIASQYTSPKLNQSLYNEIYNYCFSEFSKLDKQNENRTTNKNKETTSV